MFSPKHREVTSELLHINDKMLESLTTGGISWGNPALDGKLRLEVAGVIHGMAQFSEDRPDAGVSLVPPRECAPPPFPLPPPCWGGRGQGVQAFRPQLPPLLPPAGRLGPPA